MYSGAILQVMKVNAMNIHMLVSKEIATAPEIQTLYMSSSEWASGDIL